MGRAWIGAILGVLASAALQAAEVRDVRLWRAPDHTRVVFDLSGPVEHKLIVLDNPRRIVLDVADARLRTDLSDLKLAETPIRQIRSGVREGDDLRVVLDMGAEVEPRSFALKRNEKAGDRLVLDLYDKRGASAMPATAVKTRAPWGRASAARKTWCWLSPARSMPCSRPMRASRPP